MYNQGHGVYNETARSFYNVNPVYNPESNGRAALQVPTQHVPIYNPALSTSHMYEQAEMHRNRLETGKIVNYATNGLDAENYSLLESQARAKSYSNIMSGASRTASVAGIVGTLALGTNPIGLGVMGGAMLAEQAFGKYKDYYSAYSSRMGNISNLRSMYSGVGGNIVNPATGVMSNSTAGALAGGFSDMANVSGFSEQDMYSIHNMASQSGMMQGHTGSVDKILSRVSTLAKVTKSIMDMGAGIDQGQAMEMQRLSEQMGIDLDKFKGLEISRKIVSAARLTGKTISATNEMLQAAGSSTAAAGLGAQQGIESALYASRIATPQFGYLSAADQRRVGGSGEAYAQNLVSAQTNFASRNASTFAMGSYYVDPSTGRMEIDTSELGGMVAHGYGARESYKRGMKIVNKGNRQLLRNAGINQNFVTNMLQENMGRLGQEALNSMDKDTQMGLMLQELVQAAAANGMTPNQAGASLGYSPEQIASIMAFAKNYGKGTARTREQQRVQTLQELERRGDSSGFVTEGQQSNRVRNRETKDQARLDADIASRRADRAREEAGGIYGGRNRRQYTTEEIEAITLGGNYRPTGPTISGLGLRRGGGSKFGVYAGQREKDKSYGWFADLTGRGEGGYWRNDVTDMAVSKDILSSVYAEDFYGKGTEVISENMFGVNNSIMGNIINGELLGRNDLTDSEVRGYEGRKTVIRALEEIVGKGDRRGADDGVYLRQLASGLKNKEAANFLKNYDMTKVTGKEVSRALAAGATGEISRFADIHKAIRTEEGGRSAMAGVKDQDNLSDAAMMFIEEVSSNASTADWWSDDRNDVNQQYQTSPQKIAKLLVRKGHAKTEAEAMKLVPAVLAKAEQLDGSGNMKTFNNRVSGFGMRAKGAMAAPPLTLGDPDSALFTQDFTLAGELAAASGILAIPTGIGRYIRGKLITGKDEGTYQVTLSDIALGKKKGGQEEIENRAVSLAGVSNTLHKLGEGDPTRFIGSLSQAFLQYWNGKAPGSDKTRKEVSKNVDSAFMDFIQNRKEGKPFKERYNKLSKEQRNTLSSYIKQTAGNKDLVNFASSRGKEEYIKAISGFVASGHEALDRKGMQNFLEGSTLADVLFGEDEEGRVDAASKLYQTLRDKADTYFEDKFMKGTGADATLDVDGLMNEFGFTREKLGDQYENIRKLVGSNFGGGDFSKSQRQKFAKELSRQIDASKVKPVGASGKGTAGDKIATSVTQMLSLQSAMAKILKGLATGKTAELEAAAAILNKIKAEIIK